MSDEAYMRNIGSRNSRHSIDNSNHGKIDSLPKKISNIECLLDKSDNKDDDTSDIIEIKQGIKSNNNKFKNKKNSDTESDDDEESSDSLKNSIDSFEDKEKNDSILEDESVVFEKEVKKSDEKFIAKAYDFNNGSIKNSPDISLNAKYDSVQTDSYLLSNSPLLSKNAASNLDGSPRLSFIRNTSGSALSTNKKFFTNNNIKERKIVLNHPNHRMKSLNHLIVKSVCFIIACFLGYFLLTSTTAVSKKLATTKTVSTNFDLQKLKQESMINLEKFLAELKLKYKNQSNNFWANIKSSFEHSIIRSKDPSIVLIVHDDSKKDLVKNLTTDLLKGLNELDRIGYASIKQILDDRKIKIKPKKMSFDDLTINPLNENDVLNKRIKQKENDIVKLLIDERLSTAFQSGKRIAMVANIQMIPAYSMIIFYTYGDDFENAKYPAIMILMTLNISNNDNREAQQREENLWPSMESSKLNEYVEAYLSNIWSESIGDDQLKPLFTRIANNVIYFN